MNRSGKDSSQLNNLEGYLKDLNLLDSRNSFPNTGFSISSIRGLDYKDMWAVHIQNQWYDIRLDDNSLFFFYREGTKTCFSYLGCPYVVVPFNRFKSQAEFIGMDEEDILEFYEDEMSTSDIKTNPNYFRYDYDEESYRPASHPVAHLHCGLMDNVRIGLINKLDIMSFASIVLRQVYPDQWNQVLNNKDKYNELFYHKKNLDYIENKYYEVLDQAQDYYLK